MPAVQLLIKGRVQGVYYRASAKDKADELGVTGWVRNTRDGDVELLAVGSQDRIEAMIRWCHIGPPASKVTAVEVRSLPEQACDGFSVLR